MLVQLQGQPRKVGGNLFEAAGAFEVPEGTAEVRQGYLEASNVNPIRTMTELIAVHRTFEVLQQVMSGFKEMDQSAINKVGSTNS